MDLIQNYNWCYQNSIFVSFNLTWVCFSAVQIAFTPQGLCARQAILHLYKSQIFSSLHSSFVSHSIGWQPILSSLALPKKPDWQEHEGMWLSDLHSAFRPQNVKSHALRHSA